MTLDTAIYPCVSLPLRLRVLFIWHRVLSCAAFSGESTASFTSSLEEQFKALIARENALISKICFSYSGSVAEYDDLRQDALINIWRGMQSFRGEASHRTWIYRVTVNSCLSTIRKQSRHKHESLQGLFNLIEGDDSNKEAIEQMYQAIGTLGAQEKAIIMMWLDEFNYDEIAGAMGLNRNTVATKIRRIKDKISNLYRMEENL